MKYEAIKDILTNNITVRKTVTHPLCLLKKDGCYASYTLEFLYMKEKLYLCIFSCSKNSIKSLKEQIFFSVLFSNKSVFSRESDIEGHIQINKDEFLCFLNYKIDTIQLNYSNGYIDSYASIEIYNNAWLSSCLNSKGDPNALKEEAQDFYSVIKSNNIELDNTPVEMIDNYPSGPCYVYLMLDNNTNFYKIGMSKNPKTRESTLQSEKPTIEMIACKKYPSREFAYAFEHFLHKYFAKKNIRGEWFNLDSIDVNDLREILS